MGLEWMAWTWPTAVFFLTIFALIAGMTVWERLSPGGAPRLGWLGFVSTRGDRLFVSLLGSAFILLGWLAATDAALWVPAGLCLLFAGLVFWKV